MLQSLSYWQFKVLIILWMLHCWIKTIKLDYMMHQNKFKSNEKEIVQWMFIVFAISNYIFLLVFTNMNLKTVLEAYNLLVYNFRDYIFHFILDYITTISSNVQNRCKWSLSKSTHKTLFNFNLKMWNQVTILFVRETSLNFHIKNYVYIK